jgi:hypothetical protein
LAICSSGFDRISDGYHVDSPCAPWFTGVRREDCTPCLDKSSRCQPPLPALPQTSDGTICISVLKTSTPRQGTDIKAMYAMNVASICNMPFAPSPSRLESRIVEAVRTAGNNSAESSNQNVQFSYAARVNAKLTEGPTIARISSSLRGPALPPSQQPLTFPCLGKAPAHRDGLCLCKFAALVDTRH